MVGAAVVSVLVDPSGYCSLQTYVSGSLAPAGSVAAAPIVICEPSTALAGTVTAVIVGLTSLTVRPNVVVAVSPAAVAVIVTSVGAEVLSGGGYDQLQVPAPSFFVIVPSDAVSVIVLLPC